MKVGIYIRTKNSEDTSNNIKRQKNIIENYLKDKDVEVIYEFVDVGYSGNEWNRISYKKLIEALEKKKIDTVIVSEINRLGRDFATLDRIAEFKNKYNVKFISVNDFQDINLDIFNEFFNNEYKKIIIKITMKLNKFS